MVRRGTRTREAPRAAEAAAPYRKAAEGPATQVAPLLAWFRHAARDLPWRRTRDPYAIWISEVMLQQTRVETVKPYYRAFLARFPDVETLAAAPLDDVLAAWSGLGYYRRARLLHRCAATIVEQHGGRLPADAEALAELPGFGPYTTAAVASIAFGLPEACVDGNVARVLARWTCTEGDPRTPAALARYRKLASAIVPAGAAGDFNQAMMELGATLCGPGDPACLACPVAAGCAARASGRQREIPARRKAKERPLLSLAAAFASRDGKVLLARRGDEGLFASMWELPTAELAEGDDPRVALARCLRERLGLEVTPGEALGTVEQTLTHRELTLSLFRVELPRRFRPRALSGYAAAALADPAVPPGGLSSVTRKALAAVYGKH